MKYVPRFSPTAHVITAEAAAAVEELFQASREAPSAAPAEPIEIKAVHVGEGERRVARIGSRSSLVMYLDGRDAVLLFRDFADAEQLTGADDHLRGHFRLGRRRLAYAIDIKAAMGRLSGTDGRNLIAESVLQGAPVPVELALAGAERRTAGVQIAVVLLRDDRWETYAPQMRRWTIQSFLRCIKGFGVAYIARALDGTDLSPSMPLVELTSEQRASLRRGLERTL